MYHTNGTIMGNINRTWALILIGVIAISCLSLLSVKSTNAQTTQTLPVPEFSVKFVDRSYDVPATYKINAYSGQNVVDVAGYHIQNRSVDITIKNQPLTLPENMSLYYAVNVKGHFQSWFSEPTPSEYVPASNSAYTVINCGLLGNNNSYGADPFVGAIWLGSPEIADGGQADFQIKALIGYYNAVQDPLTVSSPRITYHYDFISNKTSDWSDIQTLNLVDGAVSNATTPSPAPTAPEFSWLVIVPLLLSGFAIAVVFRHRKTRNRT